MSVFFNAMWYFPNCNSWVIDRDARFTGRAHDLRLFLRLRVSVCEAEHLDCFVSSLTAWVLLVVIDARGGASSRPQAALLSPAVNKFTCCRRTSKRGRNKHKKHFLNISLSK